MSPPRDKTPPRAPVRPKPIVELADPRSSRRIPTAPLTPPRALPGIPDANRRPLNLPPPPPSSRDASRDTHPGLGGPLDDTFPSETPADSALRAVAELAAERARRITELELEMERERAIKIQAPLPNVKRESEARGLRLDVRDPAALIKAIGGLIVAAGVGFGGSELHKKVTEKPEQPPVAPVVQQASELAERVGRLERCLAEWRESNQADTDFVDEALRLSGVSLPRRERDPAPRQISIDPQPLINPKPGTRPVFKIVTARPAAPRCP